MNLVHLSDLHAGPGFRPEVAQALRRCLSELRPELIVFTGDLVQRWERTSDWLMARGFLRRLAAPILAVPGNHDLPVFDPVARAWRPLTRFEAVVAQPADSQHQLTAATVVGLTASKFWTLDLGRISAPQRHQTAALLAAQPPEHLRIVAHHHGLAEPAGKRPRGRLRGARSWVQALAAMQVDLVLTGHNHFPAVQALGAGHGHAFVWSQAGTATSSCFRHPEWQTNSFTSVCGDARELQVCVWAYRDVDGFRVAGQQSWQRQALGWQCAAGS